MIPPLIAECLKLGISSFLLQKQLRTSPDKAHMTWGLASHSLYVVPSILYLVQNNLQFVAMQFLDAPTYQILGNLKIVSTGVLFRVFLGRHLSRFQWIGLVLLMAGAATTQIDTSCSETPTFNASAKVRGFNCQWSSVQ